MAERPMVFNEPSRTYDGMNSDTVLLNLSSGHLGLEEDESHSQLTVNLFEISSPLNLTTEQSVI